MESIGSLLKETRESSGVSIDEVSADLNIKAEFIHNIEDGKIGCFKDIFVLKEYLNNYAKYLGLDNKKVIDDFNEYMFEYTSKIPVKKIEQIAKKEKKEEPTKISSPYTRKPHKYSRNYYLTVYLIIILLVILAIIWSIKQITVDSRITNEISYVMK